MATVCAFLLGFLGAVLVYLSHSRQRLLRLPLPRGAGVAGTVAILASLWMWCLASGIAAGLAGALTTLMLTWVALPYMAWWRGREMVAVRAEKP
jgi:membrane associated rhomboid family serine protease